MKQKGQRFDTQALTQEAQALTRDVVTAPFRLRTYRLIRKILIGFILVSIANVLFSYFFYTPNDVPHHPRQPRPGHQVPHPARPHPHLAAARGRNPPPRQLRLPLALLDRHGVDRRRVAALPRHQIRRDGRGRLRPADGRHLQQLDALARILYLESVSFDELQAFARDKEKMSAAIPAIWPIDRSALHNDHIGAFNLRRMHPVLGYIRPHKGIDLGCDRGTPVYATGDAVVEVASSGGNGGYGHMVLLNHEFGYKTRYAHLSKVLVQPGERVARGQVIAETGNTGISSGPHLHYEVIHKGMPVNPD